MKTILYIITHLGTGGAQEYLISILRHLDYSQYKVIVIAGSRNPDCLNGLPVTYVEIPQMVRDISPLNDLKALFRIVDFIRKNHIDIVHTNSTKAGIIGRFAARIAGVTKIIHTVHGYPFDAQISMLKRFFYFLVECSAARLTDRLITVARWNREKGIHLKLAGRNKFTLVRNGFDIDLIQGAADEHPPEEILRFCSSFDRIIGTVWRIDPAKGYPVFIKAAEMLLSQFPEQNTGFVMVGDGPERHRLEQLIKESPYSRHFLLCGDVRNVFPVLKLFDLFWLTSYWESLPRSICEAMILRIPVIAPAITGIPEVVIDGVTGFTYESGNCAELVSRSVQMLDDRALCSLLGETGFNLIASEFDIGKTLVNLDILYQSC